MSISKYKTNRRLYRSRNGVILGVCRGLSDYFNFNVFWLRAIAVLVLFLSGLWPVVGLYLAATLLMKPEPVKPIRTDEEREFYDSYVHSRQDAAQRIRRRYENLDRRIRRMEDTVTGREFDWDRKMNA